MRHTNILTALVSLFIFSACSAKQEEQKFVPAHESVEVVVDSKNLEHATFALGCFWHSEEIFLEIKGVKEALPGYCGGTENDPSYETVGTGNTRYAESVDITYDPAVISYKKLLEVFFMEHDPTTPNMAYPDEGPQYRSAIFYHNDSQKKQAEEFIALLNSTHKYSQPIITELSPFVKFYKAEDYHIRYYRNHPSGQSYIDHVTKPEIEKFRKDFPDLIKK
ncbi:MAG: peptide-methionine (S)-S-oxide reductase MsrA [bacterium]